MAIVPSRGYHFFDSLRFQASADGSYDISKVRGHIFEILIVRWERIVEMMVLWEQERAESTRAGWWKYQWLRVITPFRKVVVIMAPLEGFDINERRVFRRF
jgi:hypothetical protein